MKPRHRLNLSRFASLRSRRRVSNSLFLSLDVLRMCGPHFCFLKITEGVRKYGAEQGIMEIEALELGLKEKAKEFVEKGAGVYTHV